MKRPRTAYVRPRLELGGVGLSTLALSDGDFTDMRGYSDIWLAPPATAAFDAPHGAAAMGVRIAPAETDALPPESNVDFDTPTGKSD